MTALSITTAQVLWVSGPIDKDQVAGEAFDAGDAVYRSASGTWLKAQCDGTSIEAGLYGYGIALGTAEAANQRVSIARPGAVVTLGAGAAPTTGVVYYVGNGAGDFDPVADLGSSDFVVPIALCIGSNNVVILDHAFNAGAELA